MMPGERWPSAAFAVGLSLASAAFAQDKPVPIRLGNTTTSGEDQIWLMKARPDLTPNQGKAYTLETFRSAAATCASGRSRPARSMARSRPARAR